MAKTTINYTAQQAQQRVINTPQLKEYYSILCEYDWPNLQEHINWICTASISDIVDWCEAVEA